MEIALTAFRFSRTPFADTATVPRQGGFLGRPAQVGPSYHPPLPAPRWRPLVSMGQLPEAPAFDPALPEEETLRLAAKLMIDSGMQMAVEIRETFQRYAMDKAMFSDLAAPWWAMNPMNISQHAVAAWWQASAANQALLRLSAVRNLSQTWLNGMSDKWLPGLIGKIDELDRPLGMQVTSTFDAVVREQAKVVDLIGDVRQLPGQVIQEGITTFFSEVYDGMTAIWEVLRLILEKLGELSEGILGLPWWVIAGGVVTVLYFLHR